MFQSRHYYPADGLRRLLPMRKMSSSSTISPFYTRQIHALPNKNFRLVSYAPTGNQSNPGGKRNLAILLSWLVANDRHLEKYRNLYLNRGFNVLTVNLTIPQVLTPTSGSQVVAKKLFDYIVSDEDHDKVVVHAFSVGCYLWGELLLHYLRSKPSEGECLKKKIAGMVLDSPADVHSLPTGLAQAMVKNRTISKAIELCVQTHLHLMHHIATKHYAKSSETLHGRPLPCPALFFFSEADQVERAEVVRRLADTWSDKGVDVSTKCFKNSAHVSHMYMYKDEYESTFDNFLKKLNLNSD